jgi:hypothetical protein
MEGFHRTRYSKVLNNFAKNLLILPQNDQNNKQIDLKMAPDPTFGFTRGPC